MSAITKNTSKQVKTVKTVKIVEMETMKSKRFVVRQSLIGQNKVIEVTFKDGKTVKYNHDIAFEIMKSKLETLDCWTRYKNYTCTNNIPVILRDKTLV
jgi:hypothetical protein